MVAPVSIKLTGVDRTQVIPFRSEPGDQYSQIHISITSPGIATMTATIWDFNNSITPADNELIVVTDVSTPSNNAFQGYVIKRKMIPRANYRLWELACTDLNSWLDVKLVGTPDGTAFLQDPPGVYVSYDPNAVTQGSDSSTITWLFAHYAPDLPVDTTTFVSTLAPGLPAGAIRWNTVTLRQALDDLAAYVNPAIRYWIDADWAFHWTVTPTPNVGQSVGPLLTLFPLGTLDLPTSPGTLTDGVANGTTSFNYEDFEIEYDDQGWADSIYVNGATGYTYDTKTATTKVGGSGWTKNIVAQGRERLIPIANSDNKNARDAFGGSLLTVASTATRRGQCTVTSNIGGWFPGQGVFITNTQAGFSAEQFMIQQVDTTFLSGTGERQALLAWGDAPPGTIGLRRNAQARSSIIDAARRPATRMIVTVSNASPGASGVVRCYAQVADAGGNAWPVAGADVVWSVQVFDTGCAQVTGSTSWSLSANPTTTNIHGMSWTDLTVAAVTGRTYYVTATATI